MCSASRSARRPTASFAGAVAQDADDAGLRQSAMDLEPERLELVGDERGRLRLLERGLGMRMDVVAPAAHVGVERGDFGNDVHGASGGGRTSYRNAARAASAPHAALLQSGARICNPHDPCRLPHLRSARHRWRHQRRRHRARRRGPRPVGAAGRAGRPRGAHVVVEHQADPRRAALPRVFRIPAGRGGAAGARSAARQCAAHHRTARVRAAARGAPAPGVDDPHGALPLRPSGRQDDAAQVVRRQARGEPLGRGPAVAIRARLRLCRRTRRRCAARRAERARRERPRRGHSRAHARHRCAARRRPVARDAAGSAMG